MTRTLLALVFMAVSFSIHARGNAESGKTRAMQGPEGQRCGDCHGPSGNKPLAPVYPVLAGQHYDYLIRALTDYKNGRRTNGVMKTYAGPLTKQEIEDLAAWFSSQKSTTLHDQR
jgi:cytochrome c553